MKRHSLFASVLAAILGAVPLAAADSAGLRISSPVLGYLFEDTAKAIRVISGVPGAASLTGTIEIPVSLKSATVHSGARVAFGLTKEGNPVTVSFGGAPRAVPLPTDLLDVRTSVFSRSGRYLAITDGVHVEVWTNLAAEPVRTGRFHPDAGITQIAVSSAGEAAAATPSGLVLRFTGDDAQAVGSGGEWSALAFSTDGKDLFAADAARHEVVRFPSGGGQAVIATVDGSVSALAASATGDRVAALSSSSVTVANLDGATQTLACDCEKGNLDALEGGLVLQVRGTSLVLDADSAEARLFTLPNVGAGVAGGSAQ